DLRGHLHEAMENRGITIVCGEVFTKIEKTKDGLIGHTTGGKKLVTDEIMFAIGRSPCTEGLGLDKAGVKVGPKGEIAVDGYSRTSVPHIHAVGDVTDRVNLTPVAIREGHAFADSVFGGNNWQVDHSLFATAVFSTPEIGTLGMTEADARDETMPIDVYRSRFRSL